MGMHIFVLLLLFPGQSPGSSGLSVEREFEVEAQHRIQKGQQSRARKRAVTEALKKGVFEAAGRIMQGKAWGGSGKQAVHKEFGRFVSSYRFLEENRVFENGAPAYRVKLLVEVDVMSLKRALRPRHSEKGSGQLSRIPFSASLTPGEGVSSVSPAQVALEAGLKTSGFGVLPPLVQDVQPRFRVIGKCRLVFSGVLPEAGRFGATVGCRVELFYGERPETAFQSLSVRADGFASDMEGAVRSALVLAGTRLSERITIAAVKKTTPCFHSWKINLAGPVGFDVMTGFAKSLEEILPADSSVRWIAFKRGTMTLEISFSSCRRDLLNLVKTLGLAGVDMKLKEGEARILEVELKEKEEEEEDGIGR